MEGMADQLKGVLDAWAARHGLAFAWQPDHVITYTGSRGAWHVSTLPLNQRDDWISVHPGPTIELQLVADAGHVEVRRLTSVRELAAALEEALAFFQGWTDFMASGPGQGH